MHEDAQVIEFINGFKEKHPDEINDVFGKGYCYWFAHILASRFHGEIWFNEYMVHFGAMINGMLYDITGLYGNDIETLKDDGWMNWLEFQRVNHYVSLSVIKECVNKTHDNCVFHENCINTEIHSDCPYRDVY